MRNKREIKFEMKIWIFNIIIFPRIFFIVSSSGTNLEDNVYIDKKLNPPLQPLNFRNLWFENNSTILKNSLKFNQIFFKNLHN